MAMIMLALIWSPGSPRSRRQGAEWRLADSRTGAEIVPPPNCVSRRLYRSGRTCPAACVPPRSSVLVRCTLAAQTVFAKGECAQTLPLHQDDPVLLAE